MDIIKKILIDDIARINKKEKRDGRLKFNSDFVHKHPYLCLAMLVSYVFVLVLMYLTPYFGTGYMIAFTVFFVVMSAILMMEIKPVFKFEDIVFLTCGSVTTVNGSLAAHYQPRQSTKF